MTNYTNPIPVQRYPISIMIFSLIKSLSKVVVPLVGLSIIWRQCVCVCTVRCFIMIYTSYTYTHIIYTRKTTYMQNKTVYSK